MSLQLSDRWRVVSDLEGRQWILQYRRTTDQWTGRKYLSRAKDVPGLVRKFVSGDEAYQLAVAWAAQRPDV